MVVLRVNLLGVHDTGCGEMRTTESPAQRLATGVALPLDM